MNSHKKNTTVEAENIIESSSKKKREVQPPYNWISWSDVTEAKVTTNFSPILDKHSPSEPTAYTYGTLHENRLKI